MAIHNDKDDQTSDSRADARYYHIEVVKAQVPDKLFRRI